MSKYVLAPAVITSMLLMLITILFMHADEPELILPFVHISFVVCICLTLYCVFLHALS